MMIPYFRPLTPLMKAAFDGWYLGPKGEDNETKIEPCGEKCLTFSVGAPFGSAPAQPAGTRVDPDNKTGGQEGKDVRFSQRRLWVFFYRNMEGHHLHTVGLEVAFDVEGGCTATSDLMLAAVMGSDDHASWLGSCH